MTEQLPWETAERAFTLWQYDRGNPARALEAAAALIRTTPGGTEALTALAIAAPHVFADGTAHRKMVTALAGRPPKATAAARWIPFTIACNECQRTQSGEVQAADPDTARDSFLDRVKAEGWVETPSRRHLCPKCAPITPPETT